MSDVKLARKNSDKNRRMRHVLGNKNDDPKVGNNSAIALMKFLAGMGAAIPLTQPPTTGGILVTSSGTAYTLGAAAVIFGDEDLLDADASSWATATLTLEVDDIAANTIIEVGDYVFLHGDTVPTAIADTPIVVEAVNADDIDLVVAADPGAWTPDGSTDIIYQCMPRDWMVNGAYLVDFNFAGAATTMESMLYLYFQEWDVANEDWTTSTTLMAQYRAQIYLLNDQAEDTAWANFPNHLPGMCRPVNWRTKITAKLMTINASADTWNIALDVRIRPTSIDSPNA